MVWLQKILNGVREFFNELRKNRKVRADNESVRNINNRFYLKESAGKIYIMCDGTAVYVTKDDEQAHQIVERISEMRKTAYVQSSLAKNSKL